MILAPFNNVHSSFEDHCLHQPDINTNNIFITTHQDLIISYSKKDNFHPGSVNVSDIRSGKCIAQIKSKSEVFSDVSTVLLKTRSLNDQVSSILLFRTSFHYSTTKKGTRSTQETDRAYCKCGRIDVCLLYYVIYNFSWHPLRNRSTTE